MNDVCYIILSWTIEDVWRINGIFTHEYMEQNGKEIHMKKQALKQNSDNVKTYIIPLNHYIEKGMIVWKSFTDAIIVKRNLHWQNSFKNKRIKVSQYTAQTVKVMIYMIQEWRGEKMKITIEEYKELEMIKKHTESIKSNVISQTNFILQRLDYILSNVKYKRD